MSSSQRQIVSDPVSEEYSKPGRKDYFGHFGDLSGYFVPEKRL